MSDEQKQASGFTEDDKTYMRNMSKSLVNLLNFFAVNEDKLPVGSSLDTSSALIQLLVTLKLLVEDDAVNEQEPTKGMTQ